jgi:carbonic anhydrase/acetyltransferase-like protein (isoleucine patch superfamily)
MPIYALGELVPKIDAEAFVHPDAIIIGDVTIGPESSVWPAAVLRGDGGSITVGARTSIQDGSVIHTTPETPTIVGDECVIGHLVHLEGCRIEPHALVGSGSVVLHNAVVSSWAVVGANSVLLDNTFVPAGALAVGSPATIKEGRARPDDIAIAVENYVNNCRKFRQALRRLD